MSELNLEYDNTLFLLLNIISHDVIHDYNITSNKSRWENVQTYLDRVTNLDFFGGTLTETQTRTQVLGKRKTRSRSNNSLDDKRKTKSNNYKPPLINNFFLNPGDKLGESSISYQYDQTILLQFYEYVSSQIVLNAFHFIFADKAYLKKINNASKASASILKKSKEIPIDSIFYINYAVKNDVLPLQVSLVEKVVDHFYMYCKYILKMQHFEDFIHFLNILTQFLHSDIVKKCSFQLNNNQSGGVGILPDNNNDCKSLIDDINGFILAYKEDWKTNFGSNQNLQKIGDNAYYNYRQSIIKEVYNIYSKYISNKTILKNIEKNLERMIRVKPTKILDRKQMNLNVEFENAVLYGLTDCYNFLEKEDIKKDLEIKKKENNQKKLEAGDITDENTSCVKNFMKFIARVGLLIMGIYDDAVEEEDKFTYKTENKYLKEQSAILLAIAYPSKDNRSKDLDSRLYDFFKKNISSKIDDNKISNLIRNEKKCIINNAAPLKDYLTTHIFCPYSSIIDGMSNCSFNTAIQNYGTEFGDMDFNIQTDDGEHPFVNYRGFLKKQKDDNINISFQINTTNLLISNNLNTNLKSGSELKAYVVLRETLQVIIEEIDVLMNGGWELTTEIWNDLFIFGQKQRQIQNTYDFFKRILQEILFKGCGDLFQEINAVMRNGGYKGIPTYSNSDIMQYKTNSIPPRYFFAHDRPSGLRFIFMLQNGNDDEINKNAIGGYYDTNEKLMVQYNNITKTVKSNNNITGKKQKSSSPILYKQTNKTQKNNRPYNMLRLTR